MACNEIGRLPPTFIDASKLADAILKSEYKFSSGEIVFNRFKSVVSYNTTTLPVFSLASVTVSYLILLFHNNFSLLKISINYCTHKHFKLKLKTKLKKFQLEAFKCFCFFISKQVCCGKGFDSYFSSAAL